MNPTVEAERAKRIAQGRSLVAFMNSGAGNAGGKGLEDLSIAGILATVYSAHDPIAGLLESIENDLIMLYGALVSDEDAPSLEELGRFAYRLHKATGAAKELYRRLGAAGLRQADEG